MGQVGTRPLVDPILMLIERYLARRGLGVAVERILHEGPGLQDVTISYDAWDRLAAVRAETYAAEMEYDPSTGNSSAVQISFSDGRGARLVFLYDQLGRLAGVDVTETAVSAGEVTL